MAAGAARMLARTGVLAATWIGSQQVIIHLWTGVWGGTTHDPLWFGPAATAIGLGYTFGSLLAALRLADSWQDYSEERRP